MPRPKGYRDLFENPAYAGKVSWTGFGSNTAVMAYTQLAKIFGSGPEDMDAVFKLFKDHPENFAKVVRQHQPPDDALPAGRDRRVHGSTGNVAKLKSLGLKAEFVHPETGSPAAPVNIHLTKGSANLDAAYAYMDAAISKAAQDKLKLPPTRDVPDQQGRRADARHRGLRHARQTLPSLVYPDWAMINKNRQDWIRGVRRPGSAVDRR